MRLRRGTGTKEERALILTLLRPLWRTGVGDDVLEIFRGAANRGQPANMSRAATGFRGSVEGLENREIDERIARRFRAAVASERELKDTFLELEAWMSQRANAS